MSAVLSANQQRFERIDQNGGTDRPDRRHAQPGAYVALGAPIATLLDPASLEVEVDMPVRLLPALSEGLEVEGRFDEGPEVTARLRSVLPVEAVSTRTRPVRFALDVSVLDDLRLASGKSIWDCGRNGATCPLSIVNEFAKRRQRREGQR